ncbi:sigma-70 family RNA polymerase sigma factor [Thalassoroseus pseudoceratinae]|uniref:sigma-70 family RNA polymerase sigma factor n=1 Tax=Thalassoroseus pseudoceratinae TaxID=2713176 RepID=UPI00141DB192|nr:sigma-70 family RNA polymerase sigma factor [Thalassoroseus pseudoceratinae]
MSNASVPSLADLLDSARQGDAEARDQLFARCRSFVGVLAQAQVESWLQRRVDPSDIVQQTLLDAHRDFDQFRGQTEAEWLAWLKQILKHNTQDIVRRYRGTQKRQQQREVSWNKARPNNSHDHDPQPAASDGSPSQAAMRNEMELRIADAVSRLPNDYREVIILRNLQRLPFDQIADQLGRSRPATQMLWTRAVQKLRDHLRDNDQSRTE